MAYAYQVILFESIRKVEHTKFGRETLNRCMYLFEIRLALS